MMGLYEIRLPIKREFKPKQGGILGSFILGLFFGVVSSPCATPALVVILTYVATKGTVLYGVALLFTYAIGHCLLMLAAGSGFGAALGTLLCLSGCTAGATLAMLASRHWLGPVVRRRYSRQLSEFDARIAADGAAYLFSLRLLPVLPFVAVNLAAGLTRMRTWTFAWVSFVGMAAGTFVYVNAGSELGHVRQLSDLHSPGLLASLAALALLPWLVKPLLRRLRMAPQR